MAVMAGNAAQTSSEILNAFWSADLPKFDTVASTDDIFDNGARWNLTSLDEQIAQIELKAKAGIQRPAVETSGRRARHRHRIAAGTGNFPTPEAGTRRTSAAGMVRCEEYSPLVYPTPRGMLPSVRSLIDYLLIHVPAWLREHGIQSSIEHPL